MRIATPVYKKTQLIKETLGKNGRTKQQFSGEWWMLAAAARVFEAISYCESLYVDSTVNPHAPVRLEKWFSCIFRDAQSCNLALSLLEAQEFTQDPKEVYLRRWADQMAQMHRLPKLLTHEQRLVEDGVADLMPGLKKMLRGTKLL
jgi:hypothetical protein